MKGKVVVITGATSGIGQVAAEILASINPRVGPLQFRLEETNRTKGVVHQVVYHTDP